MSMVRLSPRLTALISRCLRETRGNLAVVFALALLPVLTSIGCAVDYSLANQTRAKLQAAADAASVASISQKSPGYLAAAKMTADGPIADAKADAENIFNGILSLASGYQNLAVNAAVAKTGMQLTSTVQASADVPAVFLKAIGYQNITVSTSSTSSASLSPYLDFYLMLDVSGSMGLPSTDDEQKRLAQINPDNFKIYPNGCVFACHFSAATGCPDIVNGKSINKYNTGGHCLGYALSRTAGNGSNTPVSSCPAPGTSACIQLRADAVGYSVQQLLLTANAARRTPDQFRVGLFPFIRYLYSYFPLTKDISGSATNPSTINFAAANLATLLDTGVNTHLGSGGTHFENALPSMNSLIGSVGDGSSWNSPLPFVFIVTDGVHNPQIQWGGTFSYQPPKLLNPALCQPIKDRKIKIAVLYIPYQPIQNPVVFYNDEDFVVNGLIPDIPTALKACASPGFFFTANTPGDITDALNAMFRQSLVTAHITN